MQASDRKGADSEALAAERGDQQHGETGQRTDQGRPRRKILADEGSEGEEPDGDGDKEQSATEDGRRADRGTDTDRFEPTLRPSV